MAVRALLPLVLSAAMVVAVAPAATADAGPTRDFGTNVTVFDPTVPTEEIQATLDAANTAQVDNEMGTQRYAFLFKPGTYGTQDHPLQVKVGYYTEIAGL